MSAKSGVSRLLSFVGHKYYFLANKLQSTHKNKFFATSHEEFKVKVIPLRKIGVVLDLPDYDIILEIRIWYK